MPMPIPMESQQGTEGTDVGAAGGGFGPTFVWALRGLVECHIVGSLCVGFGVLAAVGGTLDDLAERMGAVPGPLDDWAVSPSVSLYNIDCVFFECEAVLNRE